MDSYDVIIIGTGAGGGTLARHLAPSGKRILLLERTDVPRRTDEGEQRQDDRRAGHDEDRPDEECHATVHVVVEQRARRRRREPREERTSGDQAHDSLPDTGNDLFERQPQPGLEQDHAHCDRDKRLVERAQQVVGVHVVGRDPGEESRRQQHDEGGSPQRACKQL